MRNRLFVIILAAIILVMYSSCDYNYSGKYYFRALNLSSHTIKSIKINNETVIDNLDKGIPSSIYELSDKNDIISIIFNDLNNDWGLNLSEISISQDFGFNGNSQNKRLVILYDQSITMDPAHFTDDEIKIYYDTIDILMSK